MTRKRFSDDLEAWLKSDRKKTFASLEAVFEERSFAVIILVLMFVPALPLPTGGVTHVFELITMLISLEMLAGRKTLWLPEKWRNRELDGGLKDKAIPFMLRRVRWFEKFSRARVSSLMSHDYLIRLTGILFFLFALAAFLAPPFSGIDTIPSLGAIAVALALILGDAVIYILGTVLGSLGIGIVIAVGGLTVEAFKHIF